MPAFADPFSGNVDKKISKDELIQALRIDIAGELEAIYLYEAHALATSDPLVKKVLMDIRDEEKEHCGELLNLMKRLDPKLEGYLAEGHGEVEEMAASLKKAPAKAAAAPVKKAAAAVKKVTPKKK